MNNSFSISYLYCRIKGRSTQTDQPAGPSGTPTTPRKTYNKTPSSSTSTAGQKRPPTKQTSNDDSGPSAGNQIKDRVNFPSQNNFPQKQTIQGHSKKQRPNEATGQPTSNPARPTAQQTDQSEESDSSNVISSGETDDSDDEGRYLDKTIKLV